ncbi:MAG: DNA polymerase III subunit delta [Elainellaceae cyanobacterium]
MPIYLYWGDDDFTIERSVNALRDRTLDPQWASFNYHKISPESADPVIEALNQAMTPPFGAGDRFVWLPNTNLGQKCPDTLLSELERTLPAIPDTCVLLITMSQKPDGRLKSTKLLQKCAEIREFPVIPPWKTDQLIKAVHRAAADVGVKLTPEAAHCLADAVGNNTRQLFNELEKLKLYAGSPQSVVEAETVAKLVTTSTQSSLQLATAIRQGDAASALALISDLFSQNEPVLRIVTTVINQFRTWLWVKVMIESGERDIQAIARASEVGNPKRVYFLQRDVEPLSLDSLRHTLPLLLELEVDLKRGADAMSTMQTRIIQLCQLYQSSQPSRRR